MCTLRKLNWIGRDALHALRGLRRNLIFTCITVVSLGLGIGANTAIFSLLNTVLLKRLSVSNPEGLVTFAKTYRGNRTGVVWSLGTIDRLAARDSSFDGVFGWFARPINLSVTDTSQWVNGALVTGQYFPNFPSSTGYREIVQRERRSRRQSESGVRSQLRPLATQVRRRSSVA